MLICLFFSFLLFPRTSWPAMMSMATIMTQCHVTTPAMKTSEWHDVFNKNPCAFQIFRHCIGFYLGIW